MAAGRDGRWEALAIGSAIYVAFGLISTAIATVVTEVRTDLGLSFTQMGVILGAWQLMYIVVAVPLGVAIDRVGLKRALVVGGATIAASALLRGLAVDFWTMLAAVALFGIGGPVVSIGLPKLVATWFPPGERALPTGLYITAVSLGSSLGLAGTQPVLMPLFGGWREVHLALAGVGALVTLWWAVRGRGREAPASAPREAMATAFHLVVRSRSVLLISVVGLTGFLVTHGTSNWLPQLLEAKGYDPASSGLLAAIPRLAAVASGLAAAQLARALGGTHAAALAALLASAIGLATFVAVGGGPPLVVVLFVVGVAPSAIMPLMTTLLMDSPDVGPARIGVAMGVFFAVGEIGGFGGPALLGWVKDATGGFALGLVLMAGVAVASVLPLAWLRRATLVAPAGKA